MDNFSKRKSNSCKEKNNYLDYQHFITQFMLNFKFMLNLKVPESLELLHTFY